MKPRAKRPYGYWTPEAIEAALVKLAQDGGGYHDFTKDEKLYGAAKRVIGVRRAREVLSRHAVNTMPESQNADGLFVYWMIGRVKGSRSVYVGITSNVSRRRRQHASNKNPAIRHLARGVKTALSVVGPVPTYLACDIERDEIARLAMEGGVELLNVRRGGETGGRGQPIRPLIPCMAGRSKPMPSRMIMCDGVLNKFTPRPRML